MKRWSKYGYVTTFLLAEAQKNSRNDTINKKKNESSMGKFPNQVNATSLVQIQTFFVSSRKGQENEILKYGKVPDT